MTPDQVQAFIRYFDSLDIDGIVCFFNALPSFFWFLVGLICGGITCLSAVFWMRCHFFNSRWIKSGFTTGLTRLVESTGVKK